jgi:uncharacterized membrane protein
MSGKIDYSLMMELMRIILRWLAAIFFIVAGTFHFLKPELYLQIMPPYFPAPALLVAISGFAEIAGGIGILISPLRYLAGWGLIALFRPIFICYSILKTFILHRGFCGHDYHSKAFLSCGFGL